jgi:hypothetical protein
MENQVSASESNPVPKKRNHGGMLIAVGMILGLGLLIVLNMK